MANDMRDALADWRPMGSSTSFRAICPAHGDASSGRNLSVTLKGDHWMVKCFSRGCSTQDIMEALGLRVADLFPDTDREDWTPSARNTIREAPKLRTYGDLVPRKTYQDPGPQEVTPCDCIRGMHHSTDQTNIWLQGSGRYWQAFHNALHEIDDPEVRKQIHDRMPGERPLAAAMVGGPPIHWTPQRGFHVS